MHPNLEAALTSLCAHGRRFDRIIPVLTAHRRAAVPVLVRLLSHRDPAWRTGAASAFARMRQTPGAALPALISMLRSPDAQAQVAAIAAMDWLEPRVRSRTVPAIIRLLQSRPPGIPRFTVLRSNLPRAVAAHFLGIHGGARGAAALAAAVKNQRDPIRHHLKGAVEHVFDAQQRAGKARRLAKG